MKSNKNEDWIYLLYIVATIMILVGILVYGDVCYRQGVKDATVGKTELYLDDNGKITVKYNSEPMITDRELIKFLLSERNQ